MLSCLAALLWLAAAMPAHAAVTITFWSHEFGNSFPHTFFTLRGIPDRGGPPVDVNYGFTARSISPAILMGTVKGRMDAVDRGYMQGSDAQFALQLTDAQYDQVVALTREWNEVGGDARYNLNNRNCVHFVQEAARRSGLTGLDHPSLMKKPRSFLLAVRDANRDRVTTLGLSGKAYLAGLQPIAAAPAAASSGP
jgi:hypothetical protein